MAGRTPFSTEKLRELVLYVGQRPIRSGRIGLAVILWRSDFGAYARHGKSITGATYVRAEIPGQPRVPKGVIAAALEGWRWGRVEHRLLGGHLTRADAAWIVERWRAGVPV